MVVIYAFAKAVSAQQDPQYTQYIYNPSVINPAYAGSRDAISILGLHRSQWLGLDGAPVTQTLSGHSPLGDGNLGLGLSLWNDKIGPTAETLGAVDFSYGLDFGTEARFNFGIKVGLHVLDVNFNELNIFDISDTELENNIDGRVAPVLGLGGFYYTDRWYVGVSTPNLLQTKHFNTDRRGVNATQFVVEEEIHYYAIAGYVFNISEEIDFKPATLIKYIASAPVQIDITANFLFYDKLTLGAAYRWDAAVSGLVAFQINPQFMVGFAYDREVTQLGNTTFNNGSYEVFLRFEIFKDPEVMLSPRFF